MYLLQNLQQKPCLSESENQLWYIHTVEYYSQMKTKQNKTQKQELLVKMEK